MEVKFNPKILILSVSRNGYTEEMIAEMKEKGYKVDYSSLATKINKKELSSKDRVCRTLYKDYKFRFLKNIVEKNERKIYKNYIFEMEKDYDYIIDLGGISNPVFIEEYKRECKGKFILFIWDDLKYHKETFKLIPLFDKIFSYNEEEAKKYNFQYRPSFYLDIFKGKVEDKEIDLYYVGSMRDYERTLLVKKINEELKKFSLDTRICCKSYWKYIDRIGSYSNYKKYYRKHLATLQELVDKYKKSKVLLDIAYKDQKGIGLRPIEAIASKSKVITTNNDIRNYDFYNENNIFILKKDLSNINLLKEFMNKPFLEYDEEIVYKYGLEGFISDILS